MIGILGGTFDPIHYGHLRPAQEVMRAIGLGSVRLIPVSEPPHRAAPVASAEQRLEMVRLACAEFPGFVADDREVRRHGPSYTVDTLESIRAEVGDQPLCLLLGADAFLGIEHWHTWERLPELAHMVIMHRPGWTVPSPPPWAQRRMARSSTELASSAAGRLWFQAVMPIDISGTRVRAAVARNESVQTFLPASVAVYLRDHPIYLNTES